MKNSLTINGNLRVINLNGEETVYNLDVKKEKQEYDRILAGIFAKKEVDGRFFDLYWNLIKW